MLALCSQAHPSRQQLLAQEQSQQQAPWLGQHQQQGLGQAVHSVSQAPAAAPASVLQLHQLLCTTGQTAAQQVASEEVLCTIALRAAPSKLGSTPTAAADDAQLEQQAQQQPLEPGVPAQPGSTASEIAAKHSRLQGKSPSGRLATGGPQQEAQQQQQQQAAQGQQMAAAAPRELRRILITCCQCGKSRAEAHVARSRCAPAAARPATAPERARSSTGGSTGRCASSSSRALRQWRLAGRRSSGSSGQWPKQQGRQQRSRQQLLMQALRRSEQWLSVDHVLGAAWLGLLHHGEPMHASGRTGHLGEMHWFPAE